MGKLPFVHSHSAIDTFQQCPRKYQARYVTSEVKYVQNAAGIFGSWLHSASEDFIVSRGTKEPTEFPNDYANGAQHWGVAKNVILNIAQSKPQLLSAEIALAVDANGASVDYRARNGMFRGITDVLGLWETTALMADWKTGKIRASKQQRRNAICVFAAFPKIDTVQTVYAYTGLNHVENDAIGREEMPAIMTEVVVDLAEIEMAYETNTWEMRKSPLCKEYCDVVKCPHCGK
jgi:hypothetical protein